MIRYGLMTLIIACGDAIDGYRDAYAKMQSGAGRAICLRQIADYTLMRDRIIDNRRMSEVYWSKLP